MKGHSRQIFLRLLLAISAIVILTNLTAAVIVGWRYTRLTEAERQRIGAAIARGELADPQNEFRSPSFPIGTLLIPIGIGLLIAYAASRRFARPLEELSDAAERLSKGDLSTRVELKGAFPEMQITADTLNQVAESLERLERERRQMIADIAHELRNPLTAMHTRLEGLEDGFVEFSPKEVQRLQAQVSLLSRLVEDLRTLSLADAGQLSLHLREVDLQDWLVGVVEQFRPRAREKNITLAFVPPASRLTPPALSADPDRLAQVMNNLLDNALRYTPQSGSIEVGLDYAANGARVWVQDSGPGIPSEALPEIFGRFYRADASRSRLSGGSGLGLAIAKALVELHQGRIEASNRTTGGARFLFELAIKQ